MAPHNKQEEYAPLLGTKKQDVPALESGGPVKLQRTIGILSASAILFGNCVGAGIFISPKGVYEKTGSAGAGLIVWFLAGLIATLCTITYAELGTLFQESGGEFVYLRRAFGELPAFLFSFCTAFLIKPAAMAVVVTTFSEYLCVSLFGEATATTTRISSLTLIGVVMLLNIISVKVIVKFCTVISILKLVVVSFLLACGVAVIVKGNGHIENFTSKAFVGSSTNPSDYGLAFYFALYSYQSWNSLNFMTEELKRPEKTLPIAGAIGMGGVTLSYVLANGAYLMMFTASFLTESNTIAMDSGMLAFGRVGYFIMMIGLLLSCVGCLSGGVFTIARSIQSTGESGLFPKWTSWVSPRLNTPVPAVLITGLVTATYLFFDVLVLIPCLSTAEWFFYFAAFCSLLFFRWTRPNDHRPVKVPVLIPVMLAIITFTFVILPLFNPATRTSVFVGFGSLVVGSVLYGLRALIFRTYSHHKGYNETSDKPYQLKKSGSNDSGFGDMLQHHRADNYSDMLL